MFMKKRILLSSLLALSIAGCSSGIKATTSPVAYSDLDKEYGQFNTKALTVSYLKKKLDKWKKDNNGKKMLRELEYAKFKHINVLEQVINSEPDSYAYYQGLKDFIEITSKEGNDAAFRAFIVSLSPDPSSVTSLDASNITTTSFTANWSVVTNATGYMLIVDNGTPIDVGKVTSKNITGLSAGSSHTYVVKSVNEGGTSEASSPINVTLVPSSPVATDATSLAQTSFTANWGSVTGATSYNLFVDGISVYTGSSTSCNVTSLTVGSSHSYYVQAINAGGTSSNSNTINLTLNPAIAGVPVASDATDITQTSFTANWGSVTGATSYKLKVDSGSFTDVGNITSKNITGLTAGTTHTYTVQAVNLSGASADSNTISFTLITGNPNVTAPTDITNTSFTANWATVTGATSYKLFIDDVEAYSGTDLSFNKTGLSPNSTHNYYVKAVNASGTSPIGNSISLTLKTDAPVANVATSITDISFTANWATVTGATGYNLFVDGTSVYTGTSTSANITGLTANSSHSYYVTATNAGGNSTNSNTINLTLNPATPVAPSASAATNVTNTSFTANWATVTGATSYKLKIDSGSFTDVGNVTHYDISGLTPATTHTYTVQASNINGTSSNSTPDISVTLKTYAPVATSATDITTTSFTANWGSVTGANGYNLFVDGISVYTGTSTSVNITGLSSGVTHTYYVQATNDGGTSINSNTINALTIPVAPVATAPTNITENNFTANWGTVTGATSYNLIVYTTTRGVQTNKVNVTLPSNTTSYDVTSIPTISYYKVTAINDSGTSPISNIVTVTLIPSAPVATDATDITQTSFTANWDASNATSYTLFVDGTSVYTGASTSANITGLSLGTTHKYKVKATNVTGTSSYSNEISLTLNPAVVATAATSITENSFTANWNAYTNASAYKLIVDGGTPIDIASNLTSYNVTGVSSHSLHTYTVKAVVNSLDTLDSNSISLTTLIGEFRVNSYTTGDQAWSSIAKNKTDGSFIATWSSYNQIGSNNWEVYAQRYDANGNKLGSEFLVNTYITNEQSTSSIAINNNGNFIIIWQSYGQDGDGQGIYGQRFDSNGNKLGSEFLVNTYTLGNQSKESIGIDDNGNFVATWQSYNQDSSDYGIYGQRFDSSGNKLGSEFKVNTYTTGEQSNPAIAVGKTGNFIITWESFGQDGDSYGVYGQKYDSSGNKSGSEFLINTHTTSLQQASKIAISDNGNFVVTWQSLGQDGSNWGVYAQRYDSSGNKSGSEFLVNTSTTSGQGLVSTAIDKNGNFVITWQSSQSTNWDIFMQRYSADGSKLGSEYQVNTYTTSDQMHPVIAMDNNGNFVIEYWSNGQESNWSVFTKRFDSNGNAI